MGHTTNDEQRLHPCYRSGNRKRAAVALATHGQPISVDVKFGHPKRRRRHTCGGVRIFLPYLTDSFWLSFGGRI